jgi:uncharacterized protein YlxP (DUF503 family)
MKILINLIELYFPTIHSLKEKRGLLKSFQNQMRKKFNISIAEIDHQDVWQSAKIGIVMTVSEGKVLTKAHYQMRDFIENYFQNMTIVKEETEYL